MLPLLAILALSLLIKGPPLALNIIFEIMSNGEGAMEEEAKEEEEEGQGSNKNLLLLLSLLVVVLSFIHYFDGVTSTWSRAFGFKREGDRGGGDEDEGNGLGIILFVLLFFVLYNVL